MKTRVKKGLASRRIGGELFIVDAAGSRLHELNETGAFIWEGLAAGRGDEVIAAGLAGDFDVDGAAALSDLRAFIRELGAAGLMSDGE